MEEGIFNETFFAIVLTDNDDPDLKKARSDLKAMKKQAESTNREYDRLAEENQKLQVSVIMSLSIIIIVSARSNFMTNINQINL